MRSDRDRQPSIKATRDCRWQLTARCQQLVPSLRHTSLLDPTQLEADERSPLGGMNPVRGAVPVLRECSFGGSTGSADLGIHGWCAVPSASKVNHLLGLLGLVAWQWSIGSLPRDGGLLEAFPTVLIPPRLVD